MIEVIYKDEKQEAKGNEGIFSVPKNIRQIGQIRDGFRIYMEDYVYTFLTKTAGMEHTQEEAGNTLAVLTGETKWEAGITYVFIKGAVSCCPKELSPEHIEFTDQLWQQIHEDVEKYFQGQEIVGWFFGGRSLPMEAGEVFCRVHLKHFGGEKVLMLMDPGEREEAFFRYENSFLVKQSGYYLYYEKNPMMQAYMVEKNGDEKDRQEEVPDEAVKAFRKIIQKKKNVEEKKTEEPEERTSVFSYAATACLAIAVIAAGARFYQNYQSIKQTEERTEAVSSLAIKEESLEEQANGEKKVQAMETEADRKKSEETDNSSKKNEKQIKEKEENGEGEGEKVNLEEAVSREDSAETISSQKTEALTEEEKEIYKEESDLRKAERRVRESQEAESSESKDLETDSGETQRDENKENSSSTNVETAAAEGGASYIIKPGDTLYQISLEKYGSMDAVAEICRMNGISAEEIIYPGQIIVLP